MWAGTQHASHPTPLAKLARCLFSVCVNSTSCEQLFSMFGITLSRLQSRLQPQVMTDLAEIHLHLRDEHLKTGQVKERMKQKMTSHHSQVVRDASGQPVATMATTTGSGSKDPSNNPQAQSELAEDDSDSGSLRRITSSLTCDDDDDDDDEDLNFTSRKIADIFNYENSVWTEISKELAIRGLDDELELYMLIDLDAAGEDEPTMVDEMTQASLLL